MSSTPSLSSSSDEESDSSFPKDLIEHSAWCIHRVVIASRPHITELQAIVRPCEDRRFDEEDSTIGCADPDHIGTDINWFKRSRLIGKIVALSQSSDKYGNEYDAWMVVSIPSDIWFPSYTETSGPRQSCMLVKIDTRNYEKVPSDILAFHEKEIKQLDKFCDESLNFGKSQSDQFKPHDRVNLLRGCGYHFTEPAVVLHSSKQDGWYRILTHIVGKRTKYYEQDVPSFVLFPWKEE